MVFKRSFCGCCESRFHGIKRAANIFGFSLINSFVRCNKIKETLEELHSAKVIEPVSNPTPWISSMLAVSKKNGKVRVCLDAKDLNKAILRENYPTPTVEAIATRPYGNVKNGS